MLSQLACCGKPTQKPVETGGLEYIVSQLLNWRQSRMYIKTKLTLQKAALCADVVDILVKVAIRKLFLETQSCGGGGRRKNSQFIQFLRQYLNDVRAQAQMGPKIDTQKKLHKRTIKPVHMANGLTRESTRLRATQRRKPFFGFFSSTSSRPAKMRYFFSSSCRRCFSSVSFISRWHS